MMRMPSSRATMAAGTSPPRVMHTMAANGPAPLSRQASARESRWNWSHDTGNALDGATTSFMATSCPTLGDSKPPTHPAPPFSRPPRPAAGHPTPPAPPAPRFVAARAAGGEAVNHRKSLAPRGPPAGLSNRPPGGPPPPPKGGGSVEGAEGGGAGGGVSSVDISH